MTHVATMGTGSCATMAIAGFSSKFCDNYKLNEEYLKDPDNYELKLKGMSLKEWYDDILYPTEQELGRTGEYPFDLLMKTIDDTESLHTKFTIATLASFQLTDKDGYWRTRLEEWGFKEIDKTKNNIGSMNTIFVRNNNRPKDYKQP